MRIYAPSPTVRSSAIPMYMQGWPPPAMLAGMEGMGDDTSDQLAIDLAEGYGTGTPTGAPVSIDSTMFDPGSNLIINPPALSANQQDIANMYAGAVATGTITPAQAAAGTTQSIAALANAAGTVAKAATGASTAPSPRVTVPIASSVSPLASSTIIPGVPDLAIVGGGALLLFALMGAKK